MAQTTSVEAGREKRDVQRERQVVSFVGHDTMMLLEFGEILVSLEAGSQLNHSDIDQAIDRHVRGDWGELDSQSWAWNNTAAKNGYGVVSLHLDRSLKAFLVMTNAERNETIVMLPHEY